MANGCLRTSAGDEICCVKCIQSGVFRRAAHGHEATYKTITPRVPLCWEHHSRAEAVKEYMEGLIQRKLKDEDRILAFRWFMEDRPIPLPMMVKRSEALTVYKPSAEEMLGMKDDAERIQMAAREMMKQLEAQLEMQIGEQYPELLEPCQAIKRMQDQAQEQLDRIAILQKETEERFNRITENAYGAFGVQAFKWDGEIIG